MYNTKTCGEAPSSRAVDIDNYINLDVSDELFADPLPNRRTELLARSALSPDFSHPVISLRRQEFFEANLSSSGIYHRGQEHYHTTWRIHNSLPTSQLRHARVLAYLDQVLAIVNDEVSTERTN